MYKQYIDPGFSWQNFTLEEQAKVIVAPRSNNLLDTARVRRESCIPLSLGRHQTAPLIAFILVVVIVDPVRVPRHFAHSRVPRQVRV